MDYGRMGAPKIGSNKPRHADRDGKGAPTQKKKAAAQKQALLKRMQAAAAKRETPDAE